EALTPILFGPASPRSTATPVLEDGGAVLAEAGRIARDLERIIGHPQRIADRQGRASSRQRDRAEDAALPDVNVLADLRIVIHRSAGHAARFEEREPFGSRALPEDRRQQGG